jgi:hypothetical protein
VKTDDLIREILRNADHESRATAEHVVDPLRRFGTVWFADGHWWFSEQLAEIATYTANGGSISRFGEGQFEVKQAFAPQGSAQGLTAEDYERAKQSYGGQLNG